MSASKNSFASDMASSAWRSVEVCKTISENVLYVPIASECVKSIMIIDNGEELVDLLMINNPRIRAISAIDPAFVKPYGGYSKVRKGVYNKFLVMLKFLPINIGIAFEECFRPLAKQKEYFDQLFCRNLVKLKNKDLAYAETCKFVSPFIDNTPPHATGAAVDITLFKIDDNGKVELLDMGNFNVTGGPFDAEEAFSEKTTEIQRKNRLLLFDAAAKAGLVSYGYEWWHFSYGDRMWAFVKKEKHAIYDLVVDKNDPILKVKKEEYLKSFSITK